MNINLVTGDRLDNLFVMLGHDNWGLGDPEGLAHWNGNRWTWINILQNHWSRAAIFYAGDSAILDTEGFITFASSNSINRVIPAPDIDKLSPQGRFSESPAFLDIAYLAPNTFGVVGEEGLFYIWTDGVWRHVETNTRNTISRITGNLSDCYLGGDKAFLHYNGTTCHFPMPNFDYNVTDMDIDSDGILHISCWKSPKLGFLCQWSNSNLIAISTPAPVWSICVDSSRMIYLGADNCGVISWNGKLFSDSLPKLTSTKCKIESHILFASAENDNLLYYDPRDWRTIQIAIDSEPLLPKSMK